MTKHTRNSASILFWIDANKKYIEVLPVKTGANAPKKNHTHRLCIGENNEKFSHSMTHAMPTFRQFCFCVLIAYIHILSSIVILNEMHESVVVSTGISNSANRCLRAMWNSSKWKGDVYFICLFQRQRFCIEWKRSFIFSKQFKRKIHTTRIG